ncbi:DUF72 domain-containing protein [Candidatus Bathyarchaeota archaeon]|nr:DUF72 domain-containing protein [Candidatus Bathyarchaeota archaeon]
MDKIHIGTMGWSYNFWAGNFYPPETDASQYLTEYAKHFASVEVDNTFYRIPSEATLKRWHDQTPSDFVFSLKFPRVITHVKMLKNCEQETSVFIKRVSSLEDKLGPLLLQFPPGFGTAQFSLLESFLTNLPQKHRIAIEVRNKKLLNNDLYSLLNRKEAALAWVEGQFIPLTDVITTDFLYVRWEGDRRKVNGLLGKVEIDKYSDIKKWADRIGQLLDSSVEVFGYFSKYYSGHPPTDAKQQLRLLQNSSKNQ